MKPATNNVLRTAYVYGRKIKNRQKQLKMLLKTLSQTEKSNFKIKHPKIKIGKSEITSKTF